MRRSLHGSLYGMGSYFGQDFVVELEITNPIAMEPYRTAVGPTIEQYGGRFLARAGAIAR